MKRAKSRTLATVRRMHGRRKPSPRWTLLTLNVTCLSVDPAVIRFVGVDDAAPESDSTAIIKGGTFDAADLAIPPIKSPVVIEAVFLL